MPAKLLQNGTVISFDDSTERIKVLENASVLIIDGVIAGISEDLNELSVPNDAEIIDVSGKIVSPGFINTHSHMWQTAYRTMIPNCTLAEYFVWPSQMGPACLSFTPDNIYVSCLEGYLEALNAGVTTVVDHAHQNWHPDVFEPAYKATVDSGARSYYCFWTTEREKFTEKDQIAALEELAQRSNASQGLVTLGFAFDSIGPMNAEQIEQTKNMIKRLDLKAITLHYLGGDWFNGQTAHSPVNLAKHKMQDLDLPIIFSHGGFITEEERGILREHDWNLSITPESEMHYGHGQETSKLILDKASLGIDTNWTFSGDMITQARLWLQTVRKEQYGTTLSAGKVPRRCPVAVDEAFLLMTRQGGKAVRRDDLGVLRKGAKADLAILNGDSPNMLGWTDPVAAVVLHANASDIEHVLVDGEFRKRDGKLVLKAGHWKDISQRFAAAARRIQGKHKSDRPEMGDKIMGMQLADSEVLSTCPGGQ